MDCGAPDSTGVTVWGFTSNRPFRRCSYFRHVPSRRRIRPNQCRLFPEQVAYIVKDCGITALITTPAKLAALFRFLRRFPPCNSSSLHQKHEAPIPPDSFIGFEDICALPAAHAS